jgi:hypothetical protein
MNHTTRTTIIQTPRMANSSQRGMAQEYLHPNSANAMKLTRGEWHTYPTGSAYQLMKPMSGGEWAFGEEKCGS